MVHRAPLSGPRYWIKKFPGRGRAESPDRVSAGHSLPGAGPARPRRRYRAPVPRILAAIDTVDAARVLQVAALVAGVVSAEVDAVHVRTGDSGLFAAAAAERAGVPLRVLDGPTITTILDDSNADDVLAVVLGTHSSPTGRRPAGHVALAIAERAIKPVLLVPRGASPTSLRRALLPLDASAAYAGYVTVARALLPLDAEVVPLHVPTADTAPIFDGPGGRGLTEWAAGLSGTLGQLFRPVVTSSGMSPVEAIVTMARSENFDVIVMGWAQQLAHGHGSVVSQVLTNTSTSVLLLPREPRGTSRSPESAAAQHVVDRWGTPVEILLVEDDPAHVRLTQEALDDVGLVNALHVVTSGEAALDFLRCQPPYPDAPRPGLIMLDVHLPGRSGLDVLAEIKADLDLRAIPVAVLTSSTDSDDVAQAYGLGATCFIAKPVRYAEFVDAVRELGRFWFSTVTPLRSGPEAAVAPG